MARSRPDSAGRGRRCPHRSPSPPPAACRRVPSPALPRLASLTIPLQGLPSGWPPPCCSLPALRSSELYQLFKVQQKYFLWSLFLSDHPYEVLSSFSAQTLPVTRVPFRSFPHLHLGQASPRPQCFHARCCICFHADAQKVSGEGPLTPFLQLSIS